MSRNPLNDLAGLGDYLREQRQSHRLSLRQLSDLVGISNPYLSQIERGLKRPSAEILQQLAKGLEVSAESLYVKAGILDEHPVSETTTTTVRDAIAADPKLTDRQRAILLDVYESFVGAEPAEPATATKPAKPAKAAQPAKKATKAAKPAPRSAPRSPKRPQNATKSSNTDHKE